MRKIALILVLSLLVIAGGFLLNVGWPFIHSLIVILALFTLLWMISLILKDSSIVDIFWSIGYIIAAWGYYFISPGPGGRRYVLLCLFVSLWGFRLAWHILRRHKGEDVRYQKWRKEAGKSWWWISFFRVFVLQGLLTWVISSVLYKAMSDQAVFTIRLWELLGILLFSIGFYFESTADQQLRTFRNNPANKGKILKTGLWRASRHPNYFGETLIWWGFFCFAIPVSGGWMYIFSPIMITLLLRYVSGVEMLEGFMKKSRPGYETYKKEVPLVFFQKISKLF